MSAKRSREEASSGDESSDEEEQLGPEVAAAIASGVDGARLEQLKREKRLAMNRESARARRRRKKIRLETLEQQAEDLSQRHHTMVLTNQQLKTRVAQLETELATFGANRAVMGVGSVDPSSILGGGGLGAGVGLGGGSGQDVASLAATANLGLSVDQRAFQQQASMARRGGGAGALGGLGMTGMDPEMQYLQMQQQFLSSSGGADSATAGGSGSSAAARLMALEDMQRRNQLAALRGAGISEIDLLNQVRATEAGSSTLYR